ncbi:hypothetical protein SCLCIDRAFT_1209915 [Scleroderma citrinum Foug A]|uniref:Protein-lysine N-methyltransferase EFM6 n=1 Tax=Scleroderma citrinum Foug A TaxID=1036808 RepID=A0A0C3EIM8_9AGAM|nr:hypothetical protein SCLCIDRAFT_1209915 [Scleroderma citrinum Foug A]
MAVLGNSNTTSLNLNPTILADEIALDEVLDMIDPLRHFRNQDDLNDREDRHVVPTQPRSIQNERIQLTFPNRAPKDYCSPSIQITLKVDASPGCGGIAWPAGEVLSNYIALRGKQYCQGRSILELGSGTGLVGLVAGALGGRVWITDQTPLLGIMQENTILNNLQTLVTVSELNWGEKVRPEIPHPDIILAADCVYYEPAFPLLVRTLSDLSGESTEVLFCYKKRRKADKRFFTLLKKYFSWKEIEDDPGRESYNREAISLLLLTKKT